MNRFLRVFVERGKDREFVARLVNYADDFVILSRGRAKEALEWTRRIMASIGLSLNDTKTCIRNGRKEHFDFLGYTYGPERDRKKGRWYLGAKPSKKAVRRLKEKVRAQLRESNKDPLPKVVGGLNRQLRGWANYFSHGSTFVAYRSTDSHVYERMQNFLRRRHKVQTRGTRAFNWDYIFGTLGVASLGALRRARRTAVSLA
jgi:RNA-directed DNA polymerase